MPFRESEAPPPKGFLRPAKLLAVCLVLSAISSIGVPAPSDPPLPGLALIANHPAPGRAKVALEHAVVSLRHDYGEFSLARLTPDQESALREAGYEVRVFEDPDRIGIG